MIRNARGTGGCKPFSLCSVTKKWRWVDGSKTSLVGLNTSALRNAREKNHSCKTDFLGILCNFRSVDRAPKATVDYSFEVTLVFLHIHTSEQRKND